MNQYSAAVTKKKMSAVQKARARLERQAGTVVREVHEGIADRSDAPVEAVEAYVEVLTWAADNPTLARELMAFGEQEFTALESGIAYADQLGFTDEQVQHAAWRIRTWGILGGYKFLYEWATPIAVMTNDDIIAQLRRDAADGKIPFPEGVPE